MIIPATAIAPDPFRTQLGIPISLSTTGSGRRLFPGLNSPVCMIRSIVLADVSNGFQGSRFGLPIPYADGGSSKPVVACRLWNIEVAFATRKVFNRFHASVGGGLGAGAAGPGRSVSAAPARARTVGRGNSAPAEVPPPTPGISIFLLRRGCPRKIKLFSGQIHSVLRPMHCTRLTCRMGYLAISIRLPISGTVGSPSKGSRNRP